jgi:hypothetical protein
MLERVVLAKPGAPSSIALGRPITQTGLTTGFSHVKPQDTSFTRGGRRNFFVCRDLEIVRVTRWSRNFLGQIVRRSWARAGTGMRHDYHIVSMLKVWARFVCGDKETLVEAGDGVRQAPSSSNMRQTWSTSKS